ncbi:hypothetical protein GQ42DRAFT_154941 [Ramicandelaber brevisporus]|nr:hypothetical protein GQ42DRAFT_154941 [Ramicandelaber brevisporus]
MLRGQSFVVSSRGINSLAKSPDSAIFVTDETNSTTTVFDSIVQDHLFIKMRHVVELQRIFQCAVDSDSLQPKSSQSLAQSTARLMEQWMYRLRYARSMACADVIFASQNVGDCDSFLRYRIRTNQQQQQPENTFQVFDMNMLTSAAAFSTANRGDRLRQGGSMDLALLDDLDESFITKSTTSASSSSSSSSSSSTESQSPNSKSSSDAPADPRMSGFLIKRGHHLHHRQLPSQLPVLTWPDAPLTSDLQRALLPLCRTTCITHARDVAALVNNSTTCPFPSPSSVSASSRSTPDDREIQMITEYRHRKLQEFFSNCDRHPFNGSNNIDSANGNILAEEGSHPNNKNNNKNNNSNNSSSHHGTGGNSITWCLGNFGANWSSHSTANSYIYNPLINTFAISNAFGDKSN